MKDLQIYKEVSIGLDTTVMVRYSHTTNGKDIADTKINNGKSGLVNEITFKPQSVGPHFTSELNLLETIDPTGLYDVYYDESNIMYVEKCSKLSDKDIQIIYKLQATRRGEYSGSNIVGSSISAEGIASMNMASGYSFNAYAIRPYSKYAVYTGYGDDEDTIYVFKIDDPENYATVFDLSKYGLYTGKEILDIKEKQKYSSIIYNLIRFKDDDHDLFATYKMEEKDMKDIDPDQVYDTYVKFYDHNLYIEKQISSYDELAFARNGETYTGAQLRKYSTENKDTDINAFYLYQSFFKEHKLSKLDVKDDKEYRLMIKTNGGAYVSLIDIEEENKMKKYDDPDHEVDIFGKYYIPFDPKKSYLFSEILPWLKYCKEKYETTKDGRRYFLGYFIYNKYEKSLSTFKMNRYYFISIRTIEQIYAAGTHSYMDIVTIVRDDNDVEDENEKSDDSKTIIYTDDKISEYVSKLGLDDDFKETLNGFMDYLQNSNS